MARHRIIKMNIICKFCKKKKPSKFMCVCDDCYKTEMKDIVSYAW